MTACAQAPSAPLGNPTRAESMEAQAPAKKLRPRPRIDIAAYMPDFHDELRWPLTAAQHPSLEPRFAIADALAKPGVGWLDLCQIGAHSRFGGNRELTQYLRGWCNAVRGDVDTACAHLMPLVGSLVPGLEASVRVDLANILANEGHADRAVHVLNKNKVQDVAVLDLLAANYVEVGTRDDAFAINQLAIEMDTKPTDEAKCMRWTRSIILANDHDSSLLYGFHNLVTKVEPEPACESVYRKLRCWSLISCDEYFDAELRDRRVEGIVSAYLKWPHKSLSTVLWLQTARDAALGITLEGGAEMMLIAVQNALISEEDCAADIRNVLFQLGEHPPYFDARPELQSQLDGMRRQCGVQER
jgi:hypothetical protein